VVLHHRYLIDNITYVNTNATITTTTTREIKFRSAAMPSHSSGHLGCQAVFYTVQ
jgi:hypothetical protein